MYKPGTVVEGLIHGGVDKKPVGRVIKTLQELTPNEARLMVSTSFIDPSGKEATAPASPFEVPRRIARSKIPAPPAGAEKGEEVVKLSGREFKTQWWRVKAKLGEKTMLDTRWYADEFPGRFIKTTDVNEADPSDCSGTDYRIVKTGK
jgi:hypothetical protein